MAEFPGNVTPAPGLSSVGSTVDDEILYSTQGYTQKGVTLAAGQGVLYAGTALGRVTSTKLWKQYNNGGGDGIDTARGILRQSVDTGTDPAGKNLQANIVVGGYLKNSKVSGADGNAITDLGARVDTVLDLFRF